MGVGNSSVAAATAVVGYDLAKDTIWQQMEGDRILTGVALKGSAAAGDTKIRIQIDTYQVGEMYNSGTGNPNMDDLFPFESDWPAGSQFHAYVEDAPGTNPINMMVTWDDVQ